MTNVQDELSDYEDEGETLTELDADFTGPAPFELSLPDESPRVDITDKVATATREAIAAERKRREDHEPWIRVNSNLSDQVQFKTLTVAAQAMQIVQEKPKRGDMVIVNQGASTVTIGKHAGIMFGGTDTVAIGAGGARTIRTREALYAICATGTSTTIDIQEEFS